DRVVHAPAASVAEVGNDAFAGRGIDDAIPVDVVFEDPDAAVELVVLGRGRAVRVDSVQVSQQLLRDEGPQLVPVGDVEGVQIAIVGGGEDRGVVDVRARRGAAVDHDRGLRMQGVAHYGARRGMYSVGVLVLQVLT